MVVYDNRFEAKENKIFYIKDKIEPQHLHSWDYFFTASENPTIKKKKK